MAGTKINASAMAEGVADVERPRNQLIGNDTGNLYRGGGRKRADPQGIEEIGDEADDEFEGLGPAHRRAARAARRAPTTKAAPARPMAT